VLPVNAFVSGYAVLNGAVTRKLPKNRYFHRKNNPTAPTEFEFESTVNFADMYCVLSTLHSPESITVFSSSIKTLSPQVALGVRGADSIAIILLLFFYKE
jgi:hypothetical protein